MYVKNFWNFDTRIIVMRFVIRFSIFPIQSQKYKALSKLWHKTEHGHLFLHKKGLYIYSKQLFVISLLKTCVSEIYQKIVPLNDREMTKDSEFIILFKVISITTKCLFYKKKKKTRQINFNFSFY